MSTTFSEQEAFWSKVTRRRSPSHPAVIAFAAAKLRLLRSVIPGEGLTMLEVGAGNGYLSRCFAEAFDLTALDFAQNMLDQNPLPAARKVVGRAEALPFPERSFDVVFCGNLLHHLEEPIVAVREMARVTRRYVALLEPNITNPAMLPSARSSGRARQPQVHARLCPSARRPGGPPPAGVVRSGRRVAQQDPAFGRAAGALARLPEPARVLHVGDLRAALTGAGPPSLLGP